MIVTEVDICNRALSHLGQQSLIQALDEDSREAELCRLFYPTERTGLLSQHLWNCAKRQNTLALISEDPPGKWMYEYAMPTDCLSGFRIYNPCSQRDEDRIPFETRLASTENRRAIFTNQPQADLIYTVDVSNVGLFPVLFTEALIWRLALKLAIPLTKQRAVFDAMAAGYTNAVSVAMVHDAREEHEEAQEASWIANR